MVWHKIEVERRVNRENPERARAVTLLKVRVERKMDLGIALQQMRDECGSALLVKYLPQKPKTCRYEMMMQLSFSTKVDQNVV